LRLVHEGHQVFEGAAFVRNQQLDAGLLKKGEYEGKRRLRVERGNRLVAADGLVKTDGDLGSRARFAAARRTVEAHLRVGHLVLCLLKQTHAVLAFKLGLIMETFCRASSAFFCCSRLIRSKVFLMSVEAAGVYLNFGSRMDFIR